MSQPNDTPFTPLICCRRIHMIIPTKTGRTIDTNKDLTPPERHVLQKLFAWEAMAESIEQFREKKAEALEKGWNNSGAVKASPALQAITREMEHNVMKRLGRR